MLRDQGHLWQQGPSHSPLPIISSFSHLISPFQDLVAGQSSLAHASALRADLAALPPFYRRFYLQRIVAQLAGDLAAQPAE